MELCNWRQNDYNEAEPEMVQCHLVFTGVSTLNLESNYLLDSYEILNIEIIDNIGTVKIVLQNNNDVIVILVCAKEVELFKS